MAYRWFVCPALVCLMAGAAAAQGGPGATNPEPVAPSGEYPTSVAERPLALPSGVVEGRATLRTYTYTGDGADFYDSFEWLISDVQVRIGLGGAEVFLETDVFLATPDEAFYDDRLSRLGAGARLAVQPDHVVELRGSLYNPNSEYKSLAVEGTYLVRRKTANNVAVFFGGGAGYSQAFGDNVGDGNSFLASLQGIAGGMVQINPSAAADFDVRLRVPIADGYDDYSPPTQTDVGGRLLFVTPKFDVFAGIRFLNVGQTGVRTLLAGIAGRVP